MCPTFSPVIIVLLTREYSSAASVLKGGIIPLLSVDMMPVATLSRITSMYRLVPRSRLWQSATSFAMLFEGPTRVPISSLPPTSRLISTWPSQQYQRLLLFSQWGPVISQHFYAYPHGDEDGQDGNRKKGQDKTVFKHLFDYPWFLKLFADRSDLFDLLCALTFILSPINKDSNGVTIASWICLPMIISRRHSPE